MIEYDDIEKPDNDEPKKRKHIILQVKEYLDLNYEFRHNALTLEMEYRKRNQEAYKVIDEIMLNSLWLTIQLDGLKISENLFSKILHSDMTAQYHPLQEYINTLPAYTGERDYIGELAASVIIKDMNHEGLNIRDLWKGHLTKWLVAALGTVIGEQANHTCLVLAGEQGLGKSSWLNRLCPEGLENYIVCTHINPSLTDNNTANYLAEKWFVNIDDQLENIFGKDFNSMKAIITAPFVTNRKAYHRLTKRRKRVCSFMASVNNTRFLTDNENRRYLVFPVEHIHLEASIDINKVWAQAYHLYRQGYRAWFNQEEMQTLNKFNNLFRAASPEEEWVAKLYEPVDADDHRAQFRMPSEMLSRITAISGLKLSTYKLAAALEKLQFGKKVSKRIGGQPRYVYPVIELNCDDTDRQNHIREDMQKS